MKTLPGLVPLVSLVLSRAVLPVALVPAVAVLVTATPIVSACSKFSPAEDASSERTTFRGGAANGLPPAASEGVPSQGEPPATEPAAADSSLFDSLITAGEEFYFKADYAAATSLWARVVRESRRVDDRVAEAKSLTWLGLAAWKVGDYAEAWRLGEQALDLKQADAMSSELFKSYNALGLIAWNQGRLSVAADLFERGHAAARGARDAKGIAGTAANLALVKTDLGEFEAARAGFRSALAAGRDLADLRIQANALTNLAMLEVRIGDPRAAIPLLEEGRGLYRTTENAAGEQTALGHLGTAYAELGEPRRALAALDSALVLSRTHGLRQEQADNLEALAELYRSAGGLREALRLYAEAKEINQELGLALETGGDLRNEAEIHASLGDPELALEKAEEALRIHRSEGARFHELRDLLLIAELEERSGRSSAREAHFAQARRLAAALGVPPARLEVALAEARVAGHTGDPRQVLAVLSDLGPDLPRVGHQGEWEAHALRARAYFHLGVLDSAAVYGRHAVAAVERVRRAFGSGMLRTTYAREKVTVYSDLVAILLRLGRVEEAFETADAARGQALREHLLLTPEGTTARALGEGEHQLHRIEALALQLTRLETADGPATQEVVAARQDLQERLTTARTDYEALLVRASERDPTSSAVLGGRHIEAADVRDALASDELLLEYFVTADEVVLFVVTRDEVRSYVTELSETNLTSRVRLAADLLRQAPAPSRDSDRVLRGLHAALLGPAAKAGSLRPGRRLLIVPHGVLSYLPFGALRDEVTGRYVARDHALLYLPSAAALPLIRAPGRARSASDPWALQASVFVPFPQILPATAEEAEGIDDALPRVRKHVRSDAREEHVRRALEDARIVHVATHGVLNAYNPMFSRVELHPGPGRSPADDGRLEVHELLGLSVTSPLVFLSGCETGLGTAWSTDFNRGEDYATLGQALLYAGARNVIATLWAVEDAGAAVFAERFYRQLRARSPAEALVQAQRDMMRDPRYGVPYYWAGYELSGSGDL